ncbi:MAG: pilus assembly PilX N-terminal domain-containing protein [Armatimonadetes bacterium]|nr:pilus assembly PilX N-terminal domain-containing protein [Armatimonadota bacterium]
MKTRERGIALVTVLLVAFAVLGIVLVGLQLTSQNVLFVAGVHARNAALTAAEGGIYRAIAELEKSPTFSGTLSEKLEKSEFEVTVANNLAGGGTATIRSTGRAGRFTRVVEVTVAYAAGSFEGIGAEGTIAARGPNYVNAIRSMDNPLPELARVHSNSSADPAIFGDERFSVRGDASAVGTIDEEHVLAQETKERVSPKILMHLDKSQLLSGPFSQGGVPADGVVKGNLRISGDVDLKQKLVLQDGATLHVEGEAVLHRGVSGDGTLVTDGNLYVRGSSDLDLSSDGVLLFSDEDLYLVHPEATREGEEDEFVSTVDPVGDFFAQMPPDAPFYLSAGLPPGAPNGVEFFNWYSQQSDAPSASFEVWVEGDGTELNPGLPPEVRSWLDSSIQVNQELNAWAKGG